MSSGQGDSEALATARNLTDALRDTAREVRALRASVRRHWHVIVGVIVSLVLDLALTGVVTVFAIQAHDAHTSAQAARAAAVVAEQANRNLCLSSNVSRAQQVALWDFLFRLAGPAPTAQGRKLDAEFLHHVAVVFAARNCADVNPGKP